MKRRAKIHVYAVEILCPQCDQCVPAPNGSEFWSVDEVDLLPTPQVVCPVCETALRLTMPKDVK